MRLPFAEWILPQSLWRWWGMRRWSSTHARHQIFQLKNLRATRCRATEGISGRHNQDVGHSALSLAWKLPRELLQHISYPFPDSFLSVCIPRTRSLSAFKNPNIEAMTENSWRVEDFAEQACHRAGCSAFRNHGCLLFPNATRKRRGRERRKKGAATTSYANKKKKNQTKPCLTTKPSPPASCQLTGKVSTDLLEPSFKFKRGRGETLPFLYLSGELVPERFEQLEQEEDKHVLIGHSVLHTLCKQCLSEEIPFTLFWGCFVWVPNLGLLDEWTSCMVWWKDYFINNQINKKWNIWVLYFNLGLFKLSSQNVTLKVPNP